MCNITRFHSTPLVLARLLAALLLALWLSTPALATAPPPTTGRPLAEALNPDGTLKTGANGSFDARQFRMSTAPDGRPVFRPAATKGAGDERWQDGFGVPNGASSTYSKSVRVVVQAGSSIYIAGSFTAVGNVAANHVAKWNGTAWSPLGRGIDGGISALAVAANGDVYVGGGLIQPGGMSYYNTVARWDGTAWNMLGMGAPVIAGASPPIRALAVAPNGDVYVAGFFAQFNGLTANCVAKWNGTAWNSLGTGAANGVGGGSVTALVAAPNGDVYVGGDFTQAGGVAANYVAKWNGTAWSPLGTGAANGTNAPVQVMAVAGNGDVYAGGYFIQAGGAAADHVARWNGTTWSSLGNATGGGIYGNITVLALAANGDVYVSGLLNQGVSGPRPVFKWNGTAWNSLGTGILHALGASYVNALVVVANGDLYVGGEFTHVDGVATDNIAKWNGTAWSSLGTSNGLNTDGVNAIAVAPNGDVYAGGYFTQAGGTAANFVAKWNGTVWSSLGTGSANGVNLPVFALAVAPNGDVYAGGWFTQAGGAATNYIAKWNGTTWSSLGVGTGTYNYVYALTVAANGDVYAGGQLRLTGGSVGNNIAKWNGTTWSSLGTGMANGVDGVVYALAAAANGDVYVGGSFGLAGGAAAYSVAKWNGTAWSSLGTGVDASVRALVVAANGEVYAGGTFSQAGGVAASGVAKWNGTTWSSLGTGTTPGVSGSVLALAVAGNGDVYAGGGFTQAGGLTVNRVTKWNGTAWSSLGTGVNDAVQGLGIGLAGKLYAGGTFATTGDGSKAMAHFGIYDPNAPLATTAARATPAAQLFPNPAHTTATLRLPATAPRQPLTLSDALGRVVRRFPAPTTAEAELDLRGLPAGTYVVRCGELTRRLVVE